MIYVDTNVFVYAVESNEKYGKCCAKILFDIESGKLKAACSMLVLVEFLNVLSKLNKALKKENKKEFNPEKNIDAILSLPVTWLNLEFLAIKRAAAYGFGVNSNDQIHISSMELNSINEIISADTGFDKISLIRRIDPLDY